MQTQEAVKQFFLSKKNRNKLEIFQFLVKRPYPISLTYLAKKNQLSEASLAQYLKELHDDLQQAIASDLEIKTKHHFTQAELYSHDSAACFHKLFGFYCEQSTNFTIINALLSRQTNSILALSQKTNFSVPYLYTRMKEIDTFLALFGLAISFTKSGERKIVGTEIQIQYCLLDVYWTIFSNTRLPLKKGRSFDVHQFVSIYLKKEALNRLTSSQLDKVVLMLILCTDNFPYTSLEKLQKELAEHPYNQVLLDPTIDVFKDSLALSKEQRIVLNILVRLSIPKIETDAENLRQYKIFIEKQLPPVMMAKELVEGFSVKFDLVIPENQKILQILKLARNRLYNAYLSENQPNTMIPTYSIHQDQPEFKKVLLLIREFYLDYSQNNLCYRQYLKHENINWIIEDLYHLYDRYKKVPPLRIGINYTRDYYVSDDIIGKIQQVFTNEIILQETNMAECALVISDCPLPDLDPAIKKIYIMDNLWDKKSFELLINQIARNIFTLKNERILH